MLNVIVNLDTLPSEQEDYQLIATLEERLAIAERLNLLSLEHLEARLFLLKKGQLYLNGKIIADVTQQCVRTLVPLPQHLEIEVNEIFSLLPPKTQEDDTFEIEDLLEPLEGNSLDLGEIVIQLLSLNLDPYPVAPETSPIDYQEDKGPNSPFEVLKRKK